ncbi:MAG: hypothetical protein KDB65_06880 [Calditrichaeota bacterium]|nr:hypothetical protein [Calditrichota bacterium]MCB9369682.1 hypothetical protein [Calditrichota bacterium]
MKTIITLLLFAGLLAGCKKDESSESDTSYEILVGDTLITIPTDAVVFAGSVTHPYHFDFHAYMLKEYQIATSTTIPRDGGSPYTGTLLEWKNTSWNLRRTFLIAPFSHDVGSTNAEVFYYNIGTYPEQFGFGWVDTFDPNADLWDEAAHPWLNPADSTLAPDDSRTLEYDGGLGDILVYRGMWEVE